MKKTKILGVSGYIFSGKTFAGSFFERKGFYFIDADAVVDDLYAIGEPGWRRIRDYFGEAYLRSDGSINRMKLAKLVFGDARKLLMINNLIHPLVHAEIFRRINRRKAEYAVIEATYFRPKQLLDIVDKVLWIDCADDVLLKRAIKAGMDAKMFHAIKVVQEKPARIDYCIVNNGSKIEFMRNLERVYKMFLVVS